MSTTLIPFTSAAQRLEALRSAIGDSVAAIQRAAEIYRQMEEARDDVSSVPAHIRSMLRRINSGHLLPEVAAKTSGVLRAKIALLPIADQERMMHSDTVISVALPGGDSAMISPMRMTGGQINQVFGDGYIRELAEQRAVMSPEQRAAQKRGRKAGLKLVKLDREKGVIEFYGHTITKSTIVRWLEQL